MKSQIKTSFVALSLIFSVGSVANAAETIYGTQRGQQCFQDTKFGNSPSAALTVCNEALKKEVMSRKDRARTLVNRGINLNALERFDAAEEDFEEALEIWEDLPEAYANRGNTSMLQKEYDAAREDYSRALENNVRDANKVHFNRALTYEAEKRYDEAYEDLKKSGSLDPTWRETQERLTIYRERFGYTQ